MEQDSRKFIPLLSVRTTEVHPSENHQKQIERYEAMPREAFVRRWKEEILPAEKRPQYVNGRGDPSQLPCDGTTVTFHTRDGAALRAGCRTARRHATYLRLCLSSRRYAVLRPIRPARG